MKHLRQLIGVIMLFTLPPGVGAQYRMPMDIPIQLSGTFAELRSNHFHSGIDIRTQEKEGFPVYAIEDGYVSRLFISPYGFGKAVYLNHTGGITSVYAHLSRLAEPLAEEALRQQYARESYSVDFQLGREKIIVEKGQLIGWSGNSGGSGGPHLHFELRKTASQRPVNPMDYGFRVPDKIRPTIEAIRIYPMSGKGLVRGIGSVFETDTANRDTIEVSGEFYLGISCFDQQDSAPSRDGPYMIRVYLDDELWWQVRFDEFSYDETRFVNAYIDYAEYAMSRRRFQITRRFEFNELKLYERIESNGVLKFSDTLVHRLRYEVIDYELNTSVANIFVRNHPGLIAGSSPLPGNLPVANRQGIESSLDGMQLDIPARCFYHDTVFLELRKLDRIPGSFGPMYQVHHPTEPIHKQIELSLDMRDVPMNLRTRTLIVRINPDQSLSYLSTRYSGSRASARIREFGRFTLMADTTAPFISPLNISDGKHMGSETQIRISTGDSQSGVVKYRATIDGQWVLFEYDPKLDLLFHDFDGRSFAGEHLLKLEVYDDAGNLSVYSASFTR